MFVTPSYDKINLQLTVALKQKILLKGSWKTVKKNVYVPFRLRSLCCLWSPNKAMSLRAYLWSLPCKPVDSLRIILAEIYGSVSKQGNISQRSNLERMVLPTLTADCWIGSSTIDPKGLITAMASMAMQRLIRVLSPIDRGLFCRERENLCSLAGELVK